MLSAPAGGGLTAYGIAAVQGTAVFPCVLVCTVWFWWHRLWCLACTASLQLCGFSCPLGCVGFCTPTVGASRGQVWLCGVAQLALKCMVQAAVLGGPWHCSLLLRQELRAEWRERQQHCDVCCCCACGHCVRVRSQPRAANDIVCLSVRQELSRETVSIAAAPLAPGGVCV